MHNNLGNHAGQEKLIQAHGEPERSPVMSILEHLQAITLEIDGSVKVHLVESFHGDLALAMVLGLVVLVVELEVVLDWLSGVLGFLVLAGRDGGGGRPENHQDGNASEDGQEDGGEEPAADLTSKVEWDDGEEGDEQQIGEAVATSGIGGQGSIFDGCILIN